MAFITKCLKITKKEAEKKLIGFNYKSIDSDRIKEVRIAGKPLISEKRKFISGTILVKRRYMDYDYEIEDNYMPILKEKPIFLKDELNFTIFPDIDVILFESKEKASLFGIEILSKILYESGKKIRPVSFKPQLVLEAKRKGEFDNIWFNGVREEGNIKYQGQYGEEIDEDLKFITAPSEREGIGVEVLSKIGKRIKVAIFKSGSLLKHIILKNSDEEILLLKELTTIFLPYSDYVQKSEVQTELPEVSQGYEDYSH
ncbi:hypothetical protein HYU40_02465 [Candidatus Woesearchaeota archaeon]|nr:hypothetical protein [Candidatus Woesearchaeota archaeon]